MNMSEENLEKEEEREVVEAMEDVENFLNRNTRDTLDLFYIRNSLMDLDLYEVCNLYLVDKFGLDKAKLILFLRKIYYSKPEMDGWDQGYALFYSPKTKYYYHIFGKYNPRTKQYVIFVEKFSHVELKAWIESNIKGGKRLK